MVQHPIKISEENSKNSRFYGYQKLMSILSHFRARTLYRTGLKTCQGRFAAVVNIDDRISVERLFQTFELDSENW